MFKELFIIIICIYLYVISFVQYNNIGIMLLLYNKSEFVELKL